MSSNAPQPLTVDVPRSTAPTLDHERLEVYHHALQFHALASTLVPKRGLRAVRDQLERASLGVVLCIAEGAGRTAGPDKRRFWSLPGAERFACRVAIRFTRSRRARRMP
jgi:hypothetical protein